MQRSLIGRSPHLPWSIRRNISFAAIIGLAGCGGISPTSHWSKLDAIVNEQEAATELSHLQEDRPVLSEHWKEGPVDEPLCDILLPSVEFEGLIFDEGPLDAEYDPERPPAAMNFGELTRYRWDQLSTDYGNFYSPGNIGNLAIGFGAGAVMANTNMDESIGHDFFRENIVDIANEDITQKLHSPKALGDGYVILPVIGATALLQPWLDTSPWLRPIGDWGDRSARTVLVGGPFVLVMQRLVGGSRPTELPSKSHWEPFQDNNGVSGHAFVGAVPFLTAAQLTDSKILKVLCYTGSVLPALSRVNDDRHYFSQVFLGWYVAFLAAQAVDQTQRATRGFRLIPLMNPDGLGLMLEKKF